MQMLKKTTNIIVFYNICINLITLISKILTTTKINEDAHYNIED